jgi:branched-subunit amino acid permease
MINIMKTNYLHESTGNKSSNRLIFVIGSFWVMIMTTGLAFISKAEIPLLIAFYTSIQGVLIGLKLGQKPMESKVNETEKT